MTKTTLKNIFLVTLSGIVFLLRPVTLTSQTIHGAYTQAVPGTSVTFDMVLIPGGTFRIGSPDTEAGRDPDEGPQKPVKVDSFWMGKLEVSFDLYELFRDREKDNDSTGGKPGSYSADAITRPSPPYEDPTFGMGKHGFPAVSMTQYAALRFCKFLYQKTGVFYRLPTEAEWEYACRAGTETAFSFGNDSTQLGDYAWYYENSDAAYHKLGLKKPNPWGLYDMHGNVSEWTLDQYKADFYAGMNDSENVSPWSVPVKLHPRTVKGGNWDNDAHDIRSAARTESSMNWKRRDPQLPKSFWWNTDSPFVGFRLVRPARQMTAEEVAQFWKITLDE
ncbi:MAG: formylglycine-generating enzyme family protein [Bacteroidia bacterium]|nr:formylglycine-generating enzyme family protein [Bacteroidia bacterium]